MLKNTYGKVLNDEKLRKQVIHLLNSKVFKIDGLIFSLDESSLSIKFPSRFFVKPFLFWAGRPSDTRIKKFYETIKSLERNFESAFLVDRTLKPSSTNLAMKIEFYLRKLGKGVSEMTIQDLLAYLETLWAEVTYELHMVYGYDIKSHVF